MNKAEKQHYAKLAGLGCVLCAYLGYDTEGQGVELHHVRRYGNKRSLSPCLPLCTEHHRGNTGVHGYGTKRFEREYAVSFEELLQKVEDRLNAGT
jgi:hypothetical protein